MSGSLRAAEIKTQSFPGAPVIPAEAGIQIEGSGGFGHWIPASAGMTVVWQVRLGDRYPAQLHQFGHLALQPGMLGTC